MKFKQVEFFIDSDIVWKQLKNELLEKLDSEKRALKSWGSGKFYDEYIYEYDSLWGIDYTEKLKVKLKFKPSKKMLDVLAAINVLDVAVGEL